MAKERIVTGIDIGSSKICTIIAQVSDDRISVIGVSSVPSRGVKKGVIVDIDGAVGAIAASLEASERMAGYAVSQAFVLVNGSHITSLNSKGVVAVAHQEGEITAEDVLRATEAAQAVSIPGNQEIIHVLPRGFIVDNQDGVRNPVGMSGVRLEVETNIIYGSATSMKNLVKCVQQVGVDVDELVFAGVAASGSTFSDTEKELGTILADIGGGTTQLIIFSNGSPVYCSVLPIGGQNITNDLAIGLRTSLETAEKIKLKLSGVSNMPLPFETTKDGTEFIIPELSLDSGSLSSQSGSISRKLLDDIIKARLTEIFSLISVEIKKSGMVGKLPGGIVLSGGASDTRGTVEVARNVFKMPVRIGYPTGVTGLIDEVSGPAFASSVGLVLFGAKGSTATSRQVLRGRAGSVFSKAIGFIKSFLP